MKKRNEEEGYLTKTSREREPKREYHRREKNRGSEFENEKIPRTRKRAIEEQRLSESEDWGGHWERDELGLYWVESEEDPPTTE